MIKNLDGLIEQYRSELFDSVLPFWLEKSIDKEYGGYFTCLDREGKVFDTDKFIWLQGREVWMFAMLYNNVAPRQEWLDAAVSGAEFLKEHGHDGNYNFYFSTTREGQPLVEPYNIFSNTFATMAFGQLAKATGSKEYEEIALKAWNSVLSRRDNPKGKWNKLH
ncbi:MAG: AGE family epimerase/isomerase, partial [Muribaculaceae bacterium]|nr:AGE family epimerase/isomerase [Muribaculaceae bacterium]